MTSGVSLWAIDFSMLLFALVLGTSGISKLGARGDFAAGLRQYAIAGPLAAPLSIIVPLAEITTGAALLSGVAPTVVVSMAVGLLAVFTAVGIRSLRLGTAMDCHCFGSFVRERLSGWTIARNLVLMALGAATAVSARGLGSIAFSVDTVIPAILVLAAVVIGYLEVVRVLGIEDLSLDAEGVGGTT